jgi:hypothetical protein
VNGESKGKVQEGMVEVKDGYKLRGVNSISAFLILLDCFEYFVLDDSVLVVQMVIAKGSFVNVKIFLRC